MSLNNFFELVKLALPADIYPEELTSLAPVEWWSEKPYLASALALRKCKRINWQAYAENNEDVKISEMDPCLHFLRHGIYEGRKLHSWNKLKETETDKTPLVSVLIASYNNSLYLNKCIESVINQTLNNIEIIIVDDVSTDNSPQIIQQYADQDERIRFLSHFRNRGTLQSRKTGVLAATGRYIMFLDSDDYLAPNACEIAYKMISKGYDMVKFGAHILNLINSDAEEIEEVRQFMNKGILKEYSGTQISDAIFLEQSVSWNIWTQIFLREICVAAYKEIEDEYFIGPEDIYAMLAITRYTRDMVKIADQLIYYNYGPGISLTKDKQKILRYLPGICNTIRAIKKYATVHSLNVGIDNIFIRLCREVTTRLIYAANESNASYYFDLATDILGYKNIIKELIQNHSHEIGKITSFIKLQSSAELNIKHIGIFYPVLGAGGVERIIRTLNQSLAPFAYKLTVFTELTADDLGHLPKDVNIIFIQPYASDNLTMMKRLESLGKAVQSSGIDVLIHAATYEPYLIWDMLLLQGFSIPVILWHHINFGHSFMQHLSALHHTRESILKRAAAVICLSTAEELYLRLHDINAVYIHNPVTQYPYRVRQSVPQKIAVLGRLGDPTKQISESLKIIREVIRVAPWITMVLIGDFYTNEQKCEFRQILNAWHLEKNVTLTGWTDKPEHFLQECGVLLSVSRWEAFPMNIAEAQALGLPCVIYDIAIEQARNNPSIISVPQGDHEKAAEIIVSLLQDKKHWQNLSRLAYETSKKYSPSGFATRLDALLHTFNRFSRISDYDETDYASIIKYASFYSGRTLSSSWRG